MLDHVTLLYRVDGGEGATATSAGSCGGGEYNRMIMQQDLELHDAQLAANTRKGAAPYDIADIHDQLLARLARPRRPARAVRPQRRDRRRRAARPDPVLLGSDVDRREQRRSAAPTSTTLVDPYALEMDQDYDCPHNSNPSCSYTLYGPLCAPETDELGTQIYTQDYGDFRAELEAYFLSLAGGGASSPRAPDTFHDCVQYGLLSSCLMYSATSTSCSMPPSSTRPAIEYFASRPDTVVADDLGGLRVDLAVLRGHADHQRDRLDVDGQAVLLRSVIVSLPRPSATGGGVQLSPSPRT